MELVGRKEYKTAVDLFFFVWPLLVLATQFVFLASSMGYAKTIVTVAISSISLIITTLLLSITTTKYVITQEKLVAKNLFFEKEIHLSEIIEWEESKKNINVFAASNKQVKIVTEKSDVYISPVKREEFMHVLGVHKMLFS